MQLKIQYYALMREQAGRSEETLDTFAATPADLYAELAARYGFTLAREQLKVAVNSEFSDWSRPLRRRRRRRVHPAGGGRLMRFRFTQTAIDTDGARRELLDLGAGGYVSFEGWVRDHNEGQEVTRLEYEAFQELAVKEGERIVAEALQRFPIKHALCIHRRRRARAQRHGGVGGRQFRASRRGLRCLPLHHRRSQASRADLEERTLSQRRFRLGELRALRGGARARSRARAELRCDAARLFAADIAQGNRRAGPGGAGRAPASWSSAPAGSAARCCNIWPAPASAAWASSTPTPWTPAICTASRSTRWPMSASPKAALARPPCKRINPAVRVEAHAAAARCRQRARADPRLRPRGRLQRQFSHQVPDQRRRGARAAAGGIRQRLSIRGPAAGLQAAAAPRLPALPLAGRDRRRRGRQLRRGRSAGAGPGDLRCAAGAADLEDSAATCPGNSTANCCCSIS